ncbi:MAG: AsmA family protein [Xanthomonadales bacterium]|nr:AsmA family protein [Gammaproteobacteria bacterium]MBT8052919.1 AsmA family protein [Gammaproteobacteria bacterium]NNK51552.1 AsmA family protein [Xanthomonadales bacterium]
MKRVLKYLVIIFGLLLIGTLATGWYLVRDEAFLKSQLSSNTLKYTGRELKIQGPVKLSLGRTTTLEADDVHFANAPWSDEPDMAYAGRLKISIDLTSLFDDQIVFPFLSLVNCKVGLASNSDGQSNWEMGPEPPAEPSPQPMEQLPVVFRNLQIENCNLNLDAPTLEKPIDLKISSLSMQHLEDNRWESRADGSVNELPLSVEGWLSPFDAFIFGGPLDHEMKIALGELTLQSSGSVRDAKTGEGANLSTSIQGPDIGALLKTFSLPPLSEGAFDYQLNLNTTGQMTRLVLDGNLGNLDISANGELDRLIGPRTGNLQFSVDGPNLGALAKLFGIDGLVEDPFSQQADAGFDGNVISLKKAVLKTASDQLEIGGHINAQQGYPGTKLDVRLQSDEIGRWTTLLGQPPQTLGPLQLEGTAAIDANGLISIEAAVKQALTTLDVNGTLGNLPDTLSPDLNVSFRSPDASHLVAALSRATFPAAPLAIDGRLGLRNKQFTLGDFKIDLAGDQADINGRLNLENRYAGSDVELRLDIKNAGALGRRFGQDGLPDQPVQLGAQIKPDGNGLAFEVTDGNLGEIQIELNGRIPDLQQPLAIDGSFDVSLPRLSDLAVFLPDAQLPDAPFTARGNLESDDNSVQLKDVVVQLADDRATINGLLNLDNRYAGSDIHAELDIKSIGALSRRFGKEGLPDEPVKLTARVQPSGKGMAFELHDGNLRDIQVEVKGNIPDMAHPLVMDAAFDIDLPRLNDISFLMPGKELPDAPFSANGRLKNRQSKTELDQVRLTLGANKAEIYGDLLADNRFNLLIKASGPDASTLEKVIGQPMPAEAFSVSTQLDGGAGEFYFSNLEASLGQSRVGGNIELVLGDVTRLNGNIKAPQLDLSFWDTPTDAAEPEPKPAAKREWMFADTPVVERLPQGLEVQTNIQVDELIMSNTSLTDIELGIALTGQSLDVIPFRFSGVKGGSYQGSLRMDATGPRPKLDFEAAGKDIRVGIAAAPGQDPATFAPIELDIQLTGEGTTHREMASSVDGKIRIFQGSGQVAKAGLDLVFSDFMTQLFTTLNPFAKTSEYTQLDCAVFSADAVQGQVSVFPVIFHTEQLTILSEGTVDLHSEKMDLSFNTKPRTGLGLSAGVLINPLIKVGGRLTSPAIEMDPEETVKTTGLAVATVGISLLAKSLSDRFLSSADPCGDARKEIEKRDSAAN